MAQSTTNSDLVVTGALTVQGLTNLQGGFTPPGACVGDVNIAAAAGIKASKLQHQYEDVYAQGSTTTAAAAREVLHIVHGATATLVSFQIGAVVANIGAATVVFDLLKNGSSILTGTITLDSTTAAYVLKAGVFSSTASVAGDVFEAKVTSATAGGGTIATGVFMLLVLVEDAQ